MENQEINPLKDPEGYQKLVLDSMSEYENLLGELYAVFAERFPEHKDFWMGISKEEGNHAYWIKTLQNKIGDGKVFFNEQRFHINPLRICLNDVAEKIAKAKSEELDMLSALSISDDLEKGMIERKFFEVFESDSADIKNTFEMLQKATMEHGERVSSLLEKERAMSAGVKKGFLERIREFFS